MNIAELTQPTDIFSTEILLKHIVFIDSTVDDYSQLIVGALPGTEVFLLHSQEDGIEQISAILANRPNIASVHILAHGSPGSLQLGRTRLCLNTLERYQSQLQQWRQPLHRKELLLYGCNVASGEIGDAFIKRLKALTGASIAASTTLVGASSKGGNWDLDLQTEPISTPLAFQPEILAAYSSVLAEDPMVFLEEDFSDSSGVTPPPGWSVEVLAGNPETDIWRFDNPGDRDFLNQNSAFSDPYAVYDSDALSNDNLAESVAFVSPLFDASASSEVFLEFDQVYNGIATGNFASEAFVEASADDGETWEIVYSSDASGNVTTSPKLDLTDELGGAEAAQVRFRFDGNWSFAWAIDNVRVVDSLPAGVSLPNGLVGVSEDDVPDPLDFTFALNSRPSADVTLEFSVDGAQLQPIESITFSPDNWNQPQTSVVSAIDDGIDEGNDQVSFVNITVTSDDPNYNGLPVEAVEVQITDNAIPGYTSYRTVEKTYEDLSLLAAENPDLAEWFVIGESYDKVTPGGPEGYDINVLKLTNQNIDVEKPAIYIEGSIHAREYTTAELVTRFGEGLVASYGVDPDATWLLDYHEIHIVPIVNPDARKFAEQGYSWRRNTNPTPPPGADPAPFPNYGVDLNRNFDFKWNDAEDIPGALPPSSGDPSSNVYRGAAPASEPEVQTVQNYVRSIFPDQRGPGDADVAPADATGVFLDVHSFGNLVLHPWGWTEADSPNEPALRTLGRKYGFYTGQGPDEAYDVDESLGLYPTDGTSGDWAYGELGVAGYIIELGETFFQPSEDFETEILPENIPALTYMAKAARRPYQTPAGPEAIDVNLDLPQVVAGQSVVLTALADDTRYDDGEVAEEEIGTVNDLPEPSQAVVAGRYSVNQPSWLEGVELVEISAADGAFDSSAETLSATIDTAGWESGRYTIFVESQDADGNWGVPTATFLDIVAAPDDAVITEGSEASETLVGRSGSDVTYALGGNDIVAGGLGDDVLFGGDGDDVLRGDRNRFNDGGTFGGDDVIYGGDGNDRIGGKAGDDTLYGDAGDDRLWGDDGDDVLWGGGGDDILTGDNDSGGRGSDTFVLAFEAGTDTITDFEVGTDFIGLFGTLSFGQLSIRQAAEDALISFNQQTLAILSGIEAETLTEASFVPA